MGQEETDVSSGLEASTNLPNPEAVTEAINGIYEGLCSLCDALGLPRPPHSG